MKISFVTECFEDETEYIGRDIAGINLETETPEKCQTECIKEETCNAWTFDWDGTLCKLKYAVAEKGTANPSTISGPKFCFGKCKKKLHHTTIKEFLFLRGA